MLFVTLIYEIEWLFFDKRTRVHMYVNSTLNIISTLDVGSGVGPADPFKPGHQHVLSASLRPPDDGGSVWQKADRCRMRRDEYDLQFLFFFFRAVDHRAANFCLEPAFNSVAFYSRS